MGLTFTAKKLVLDGVLDRTFAVASKSGVIPVLNNVELTGDDEGVLSAVGGDGEVTLLASTSQVEITETGKALVPIKVRDIVRACPDEDVTFAAVGNVLTVRCAGAEWEVRLEDDEYPAVGELEPLGEPVSCEKKALIEALDKVRSAVGDPDRVRPQFQFVQVSGGVVRATDGNRLHQSESDLALVGELPYKSAMEVLKRAKSTAGPQLVVVETEHAYVFKCDDDMLVVGKHVTKYPDVQGQMLAPAQANNLELAVDRRTLQEAVARVSLLADNETNYLSMAVEADVLTLAAYDKMGNKATERIDVFWPYERREMGVNHEHLKDMLSALRGPRCKVYVRDEETNGVPSLLRFEDDGYGFTGVLVQLRRDLGEAAKGSRKTRAAQNAAKGWEQRAAHRERSNQKTPRETMSGDDSGLRPIHERHERLSIDDVL